MKSASRPAPVMLAASAVRSSDSTGESCTTCWKFARTLRCSASISIVSASRVTSGASTHFGAQVRPRVGNAHEPDARQALDDQPQAAVGQLEHLVDVGERADRMEIVLPRLFLRRILLREDADQLAAGDRLVDQPDGALAGDGQRHE